MLQNIRHFHLSFITCKDRQWGFTNHNTGCCAPLQGKRDTEAEDPGRHMPSKLLASNAPYPILLHFALRSIYCYTVISEITQISGASQPITQPPENSNHLSPLQGQQGSKVAVSHQQHTEDALLLSQRGLPAPAQTFRAGSCRSLTYTSQVRGTFT